MATRRRARAGASLSVLIALGLSACGSPTAPADRAPVSLSVSAGGVSAVVAGRSVQLVALAAFEGGTATNVTAAATWRTSDPAVATVSPTGLLTGLTVGETTVIADYQGRSAMLTLGVVTRIVISACGSYFGAGPFELTADLVDTSGAACLTFSGNVDAMLDCQGYDASSIYVTGAQGMVIRNCRMHGSRVGPEDSVQNVALWNSTGVTVEDSDVLGNMGLIKCVSCALRRTTILSPAATNCGKNPVVRLIDGQNNQILDNTLDGGYDGLAGCENGVRFSNEANLTLRGNVMRRFRDAGIEVTGDQVVTAPIIEGNTIAFALTGIGAYWVPGWRDAVISGNTVTDAGTLLYFVGLTVFSKFTFVNNQIVGNSLVNAIPAGSPTAYDNTTMRISYAREWAAYEISGNLIQANNFGTTKPAPIVEPPSGFIDGGGNICTPGGVLACGGW